MESIDLVPTPLVRFNFKAPLCVTVELLDMVIDIGRGRFWWRCFKVFVADFAIWSLLFDWTIRTKRVLDRRLIFGGICAEVWGLWSCLGNVLFKNDITLSNTWLWWRNGIFNLTPNCVRKWSISKYYSHAIPCHFSKCQQSCCWYLMLVSQPYPLAVQHDADEIKLNLSRVQKTGHGESTRHTTEHNLSKSVSFYIKHVSQRATLRHTYQHLALIFAMVPVRTPFNGVRLDL